MASHYDLLHSNQLDIRPEIWPTVSPLSKRQQYESVTWEKKKESHGRTGASTWLKLDLHDSELNLVHGKIGDCAAFKSIRRRSRRISPPRPRVCSPHRFRCEGSFHP